MDEIFDADRFAMWIAVLMQAGPDVAVEKLLGLDIDLVIAGFSRHLAAFDGAVVAGYTMLDGVEVPGRAMNRRVSEIGGYAIEAKRSSAWEPLVDLLAHLEAEHQEYFHGLMRGCVRLSNGAREEDASHQLLEDGEQYLFDLSGDRQARREEHGYVSPAQAHAFLQSARDLRLDADRPPSSPIARAYFRAFAATLADVKAGTRDVADTAHEAGDVSLSHEVGDGSLSHEVADGSLDRVLDVLRDAGIIASVPRALLSAGDSEVSRLAWLAPHVAEHPASAEELAYLANAIVSGCSVQGRPFTEREAGDAVVAICNLGLQNWPSRWRDRDLISAFQVGWGVLYRDVCLHAAKRLIDVLGDVRTGDLDTDMRLHGLRRELIRHLADGEPWRAREALDVILALDAPSWAGLVALIDECPVMHAAVGAAGRRCRTVRPADFTFISQDWDIDVIREFLESLPEALHG